jgi:catalase
VEDFLLREKITYFDHERIPERLGHARGEAAHGHFQGYESMAPFFRLNRGKSPRHSLVSTDIGVQR